VAEGVASGMAGNVGLQRRIIATVLRIGMADDLGGPTGGGSAPATGVQRVQICNGARR